MAMVLFTATTILTLLAIFIGAFYWYSTCTYRYWKSKGVPFVPPVPLLGNVQDTVLLKRNFNFVHQDLYNRFEGHRFVGMFMGRRPALLLRDPELIKIILIRDFEHFHDRDVIIYPEKFPLQQSLLNLSGHKWKMLRKRLAPSLSSGRLKYMFPLLCETSVKFVNHLQASADGKKIVNLQDALYRFANDTTGSCIFGIQMNALQDPNCIIFHKTRKIFERTFFKRMAQLVNLLLPEFGNWLTIDGFGSDVTDLIVNVVKDAAGYRMENNISRKDFLDLLINMRYKEKSFSAEGKLNEENGSMKKNAENLDLEFCDGMMAAQSFIFFLAGFVNAGTVMGFAMHELAENPRIQWKLREELDASLEEHGGEFTYESVINMKYLDKVVSETLRKYPVVQFLRRAVTVPYTIPGTSVTLDEGTSVTVPIFALHRDPKHFPDPDRFDPERFSEEEKAKRHNYVYLPFGEGPRNCIGMRFGLLLIKLALASLLSKFEFHVCEQTPIPLRLSPRSFVLESTTGCIVRITNRSYRSTTM